MNDQLVTTTPPSGKLAFRPGKFCLRCQRAGSYPRVALTYYGTNKEQNRTLRNVGLAGVILAEFAAIQLGQSSSVVAALNPSFLLLGELTLAALATWGSIRIAEIEQEALIAERENPDQVAIIRSRKLPFKLRKGVLYLLLVTMLALKVALVWKNAGITQYADLETQAAGEIKYDLLLLISALYVGSFVLHLFNSGIAIVSTLGVLICRVQKFRFNSSGHRYYSGDAKPHIFHLDFPVVSTACGGHWLRHNSETKKSTLEVNGILTDRPVQELLRYQTGLDDNGRQQIMLAARKAQLGIN